MATMQLYFDKGDLDFDIVDGQLLIEIPVEEIDYRGTILDGRFVQQMLDNGISGYALDAAAEAVLDAIKKTTAVQKLYEAAK